MAVSKTKSKSKTPYIPYIPTKQERKLIKRAYKAIEDNLSSQELISLKSSLYNGEVPFELTIQDIQPTEGINYYYDEFIELLYLAFDKYDTVEGFVIDRKQQHIDNLIKYWRKRIVREKKKAKGLAWKRRKKIYRLIMDLKRLIIKRQEMEQQLSQLQQLFDNE